MLAKLTSKNQLTLPKAATRAVAATDYFEVETRNGVIILTPVRIQRSDAVRAKLAELELLESDIDQAVSWARQHAGEPPVDRSTGKQVSRPSAAKPKTGKRREVR